jgi:uncharacterized protein (TIGR00730 family)
METVHTPKKTLPQARLEELLCKSGNEIEAWRVFKIMSEFVDGFELLRKYEKTVSFFGSSRTKPGDASYELARDIAAKLSKKGYTIITGGSGGIMEAANRGAFESGGSSVGLNINLSNGQEMNQYVTDSEDFDYFFVRKVMLSFAAQAYLFFPGGFGTLDEFFEMVTLVQTKRINPVPIILVGKGFWEPFLAWIEQELLLRSHAIDESDMNIYTVVDSADEAVEVLKKHAH